MATTSRKRPARGKRNDELEEKLNLFVDAPADDDDEEKDSDKSDSDLSEGFDEESGSEQEGEYDPFANFDENDSDEDDEDFKPSDVSDEEDKSISDMSEGEDDTSEDADDEETKEPVTLRKKGKQLKKGKQQGESRKKKAVTDDVIESSSRPAVTGESPKEPLDNQPSQGNDYEFDSSDEEDIRNTVGNIPMEWYEGYKHLGYDVKGQRIVKPEGRDKLDEFLNKMDNPDYWRTIFDKKLGKDVVLNEEQLLTIQRIQQGFYPETTFDPYEPYIDHFTYEKMIHPVTRRPAHKRSFIPSLTEKDKVSKLVHAIKMGWMKLPSEIEADRKRKEEEEKKGPKFYDLWGKEDNTKMTRRHHAHIAAPKMKLPGHEESYNPLPEYLPTEEEVLAWNEQDAEDRKSDFVPKKYDCLRKVPYYPRFIQDRFERCLDLYLCPRQRRMRVQVEPEELLPKLPRPKDLQPFPTTQAIVYEGHKSYVRSISTDQSGEWFVSGSDDKTVRFWEVSTGRCMKTIEMADTVLNVAWCPNPAVCLVAVCAENSIYIINPHLGDKMVASGTDRLIEGYERPEEMKTSPLVEWIVVEDEEKKEQGFRLQLKHFKAVKQVTWHGKGDYFSAVIPDGGNSSVLIHQLSKRRSQAPFKKNKGLVQCVAFHPTRPFFFVATQRYIRVYHLMKQELTKKLLSSARWVSSISIHPAGDNVLIGSYDCRVSWFDMDLSTKPYQTLRHHRKAVRQVNYHHRYPLFASASDDGAVMIFHGQVYNDLLQNPLIVPVKILRGHVITNSLGVLACEFHPTQPWILTAGADATIRLFT
ncbi:ribosome biogenesis protein bop1-B [Strongylocentrotus purpuratus]|uniref:Ribosome biogenesis protein BOP1 homolog n=1 Tax=Strongylocentrotus purpuratus TaxID=7668 RepID=A0A7M7R9M9_STRPU|nr:ribosome biogenesis protein bop1-B [Strongylocentrotus purpuratus]